MKHIASLSVALLFALVGSASAARPTDFLKQQVQAVRGQLGQKVKAGSPEAAAQDAKLMAIIEPVMEFEKLSERALRKHWPTLTAEQKAEFIQTFRQLVFRSYLSRVRSADEAYTIDYEGEEAKSRTQATVSAVAKTRKAEIELVFQLEKKGDAWVAEDIVIDEVSLTENYREQFNKIIADEGFPGLIAKMVKKLDKLGGPVAAAAPAAPAAAPA
ncbi:MAG: ABC transporter substrate-binding protein, partial [Myxococcales bacterium]|nr:ABC transporter substrate-binding protein [Myxococcales bacterium]